MILLKSCDLCGVKQKPGQCHFPTSEFADVKLGEHHPMRHHDSLRLWAKIDTFSGSSLVSGSTCKPDLCTACFVELLGRMIEKMKRKARKLAAFEKANP